MAGGADPWHDKAIFRQLGNIWNLAAAPEQSAPMKHHKLVWCDACKKSMVMRWGARGCYTGHVPIREVTEDEARALAALHAK